MFSRQHRKVRVLFGLSDIALTALAFECAYQTRIWLHLERVFFLPVAIKALVLGFSLFVWVSAGLFVLRPPKGVDVIDMTSPAGHGR